MRDRVELSADAWMPLTDGSYPAILIRTPYGKSSPGGRYLDISRFFVDHGYVFIVQDVRGTGDSDGEFLSFHQEARDGYDTVEWVARQPWSNGKIGMMGGSYSGTVQWLAAREKPPHLTCLVSTAAWADPFEEGPYHQGVFNVLYSVTFTNITSRHPMNMDNFDQQKLLRHRPLLTMDAVLGRKMPRYRELLEHNTLDDYWRQIIFTDDHFKGMNIPALHLTGWFDVDQIGALIFWRGMAAHSAAADRQFLLIGPWQHEHIIYGGREKVGELRFPEESILDFDDFLELHVQFFDHFMKQARNKLDLPRARIYVTGSNKWMDLAEYPLPNIKRKRLYLHSTGKANTLSGDGKLSWHLPDEEPADHFVFDPQKPISHMIDNVIHAFDNRFIEEQENVLVYTSDVLDRPLDVIGKAVVELYAASNAKDTDFVAKLLDVYPDGRAVNLGPFGKGFIRARYRKGYQREVLLTPNRPEIFSIKLFDIGHTFLSGHRIRVEITSSDVPYMAPNQNTGNSVATDTEWKIASQMVLHTKQHPSSVILPVVEKN
jgi:putative CocE/NonD family hydrolase